MKARNNLVKLRLDNGKNFIPSPKAMQGLSTEHKLIWQYLLDSAGLPLHIRRTFDQFGYPNLEDTKERDFDQVVFKWAKDANDKLRERSPNAKNGIVVPGNAQLPTLPSVGVNMFVDKDDLKVLMVDQLWCWIINEGQPILYAFLPYIVPHAGHFF